MNLLAEIGVSVGTFRLECEVAAGGNEIVAVVGPNGAGKTTLLRVLAGLVPLDSGRISLGPTVLDDPAAGIFVVPEDRRVGVVFQDGALFPHLSAVDNVAFGLRARGTSRAVADRTATAWLTRLGLGARTGDRPGTLSGGQAQRVALARALAAEPDMVLLDEPLTGLDAATRDTVRRDLAVHLRSFAGVRLVVTHDAVDALALADRIVVLEAGRVTQSGTAADIVARPRSAYVADLVGTNLYRGHAEAGAVRVDADAVIVTATSGPAGPVYVVVHPRAVSLHRHRPDGTPRNVWPGRVRHLERLADRVRVQVDGALSVVAEVTPAAVEDLGLAEGVEVWAAVKATEVDVYAD